MRGACQGLMAFILWGVGAFVGTMLAGKVLAINKLADAAGPVVHNWKNIWLAPAIGAVAVLVVFVIFFRDPPKAPVANEVAGRKGENLEVP